ncbi:MAG TPA: hypothetical protein VIA18_04115 [Polyangia bacterium]|nr:hypothetical protein [Polyangia bacterium]
MSDIHNDGEARLLVELLELEDDRPEPPAALWTTMAANVRDGYVREQLARRRRRTRTRLFATTASALALAAALTFWLRPRHHVPKAPQATEQLDEMTVFGDELDGDELEEMSAAQLEKLDSAFKKGA